MPAAKIVIVDDEVLILEFCKIILSEKYEVITESNSKKALNLISNEKPDLIIMDLKMPGMDGFRIFDLLKENNDTQNIPVLFITASTSDEELPDTFWQQTLECDGFLSKPFDSHTLLARIEDIFRKKLPKKI